MVWKYRHSVKEYNFFGCLRCQDSYGWFHIKIRPNLNISCQYNCIIERLGRLKGKNGQRPPNMRCLLFHEVKSPIQCHNFQSCRNQSWDWYHNIFVSLYSTWVRISRKTLQKEEIETGKKGKLCVVRITVTKNKLCWCHGYLLVQNADCRPDTKCRLQTSEWVLNADWESKEFFRLVCDNMSSYNLPSVTQSLFRDQLSRLFALLWNTPGPFLDQNRS